jgi:pyruvate dehydrogenase E2 component (dihydrolipoamide acetyltransferase)
MSKFEFKLPDIGEGVSEGEIVNWLIQDGDSVEENQDMVEVMTDKATVTIGAPKTGKIVERRFKVGDTVPVGEVLVVLDLNGGAGAAAPAAAPAAPAAAPAAPAAAPAAPAPAKSESGPVASAVGDIREDLPGINAASSNNGTKSDYYVEKPLAAPATRKLARELGVDLRTIEPSGSAGRVTREDVERAASGAKAEASPKAAPAAATETKAPPGPEPVRPEPRAGEERVPIRGLRKRIFENMARSKHTAAHFNYIDEVNVSGLIALRERTRPHAERAGVKLSFLPFITKAVVAALKKHPRLNSIIDESAHELVLRKNFDIGIAVATEAGLMVAALREADRLSILEIAREIDRLAQVARSGKIQKEDLGGTSFTITSLGKLGGLIAPPIINYPEVGIMGVHAIKKKPVVKGDQIVIGDVMMLSFSFDHRIIDGDVGAEFAQEIIAYLEDTDRLIVEMS